MNRKDLNVRHLQGQLCGLDAQFYRKVAKDKVQCRKAKGLTYLTSSNAMCGLGALFEEKSLTTAGRGGTK